MKSATTVVEACDLRKSFGSRLVLDGLSLSVGAGEVVGLLGPNGAGKTTTLSILSSLLRADSGEVRIAGIVSGGNDDAVRRKLGMVPQSIALYPSLTALQNLEFFARVQGIAKPREACTQILATAGLAERAHDAVATLSGGMKRRLNLACGMVHRPDLLLLDEPTAGVDPQSREHILATVRRAADDGTAVIYSTHYMEEVERLCDRALLIDLGRVVAAGTVAELITLGGRHPRMEITLAEALAPGWCAGMADVRELMPANGAGKVALELSSVAQVSAVLERAHAAGGRMIEFSVHSPNLSDAFIALTGHALREPGVEAH